jgi:Protein of unknown function (DUF2877)
MSMANALCIASDGREWLEQTHNARVLHVFERACNLLNERGQILSIVTSQVPIGPFTLLVKESGVVLSDHIQRESAVVIEPRRLKVGEIYIDLLGAQIWSPLVDWAQYHQARAAVLNSIWELAPWIQIRAPGGSLMGMIQHIEAAASFPSPLPLGSFQSSFVEAALIPAQELCRAIVSADLAAASGASRRLAGLGPGLTPAGDDFLLGAIYAAWILHPPARARTIVQGISTIAATLTTALSAAYLNSGAQGKAGVLWHKLFAALASNELSARKSAAASLLSVGNTSGADTLAGFLATLLSFEYSGARLCLS